MAEPEPQQQAPLQVDELGVPCLYIVGHEAEEPLSVRDLTAKLVGAAAAAAAPGDGGCRDWRVYIPPATADDATPVIELADLDELTELDGDDMQELEGQILSALVATTQAASSSSAGGGGGAQQLSQRKHPITLTSWCTLTPEEAGWTRALQAAATAAQPAVQDFVRGLSIFEIAQFAIIAKGDVTNGLQRMEKVAGYRKQYSLGTHSAADVCAWLDGVGVAGSMCSSGNSAMGRPVMAGDAAQFVYDKLDLDAAPVDGASEPLDWQRLVQMFWSGMDACTATLDDVRGGCEMVFLGRGMGMKNYNHDAEEKFAGMYQDCYPIKFKVFIKKKLRKRIFIISSKQLHTSGIYASAQDTPHIFEGGLHEGDYRKWLFERLERRKQTIAAVKLPPQS